MKNLFFHAADDGGGAANGSTTLSGDNAAPTETTKRKRGPFDKELQAEIRETDDVILAARRPEFATLLASEQDVSSDDVDELESQVQQAATLLGITRTGDTQGQTQTEIENAAEDEIVAAIHRIHTGVRRTFSKSRAQQRRYFIGTNIEANEDDLTTIAATILQLLETDTLKGVGPTQITRLTNALQAWKNAHNARGGQSITTAQDRKNGLAILAVVGDLRRDIQFAADGIWPYTNPANIPARRAFHLPEHRPFVVAPSG